MDLELKGKYVLVTGGSRGIGRGITAALVREGCRVAVMSRGKDDLDAIQSEAGAHCETFAADAMDPSSVNAVMESIRTRRGKLDGLVTCVGSGASVRPGTETSAEWQRVLAINLLSATNVIEGAMPLLRVAAPSFIVCLSSICGCEAFGAPVTYSASKAALAMAVKAWSREFAKGGVRINLVSPGNVLAEGGVWHQKATANPAAVAQMLATEVPMGRFGTVEEIADAVLFLGSARAAFITGANLVVDGGQTRSL